MLMPPSAHLVFPLLRTDKVAQTDEHQARQRRTVATLNEYYGSHGSVLLASSLPRQMTYYLMPSTDYMFCYMNTLSAMEMQWYYWVEPWRPVSLYIDFDAPAHCFSTHTEFYGTAALCASYLMCFLAACYFGSQLVPTHYDGEWRLFCASTDIKWSLHAHCRLWFRDIGVLASVMQNFMLLLRDTLLPYDSRLRPAFYTDADGQHCILDMSVYNQKGRLFRLPLCRKTTADDNPLLPLHLGETATQMISWGLLHPAHGANPPAPPLDEPPAPTSDADVSLAAAFAAMGATPDACALLAAESRTCTRREMHAYCSLFLSTIPEFGVCRRYELCSVLSGFARASPSSSAADKAWLLCTDHFFSNRTALQSYAATTTLRIGMIRMLPMSKGTKEGQINAAGSTRLQSKLQRLYLSQVLAGEH